MLPSQGLFKIYQCPLFENSNCLRPYCHFKHAKKDEVKTIVDYIPTPIKRPLKLLTLDDSLPSSSKKTKLEYVPTKPAINSNLQNQKICNIDDNIPVYKPSSINNLQTRQIKDNIEENGITKEESEEFSCTESNTKESSPQRSIDQIIDGTLPSSVSETEKINQAIESENDEKVSKKEKHRISSKSSHKRSHSEQNKHRSRHKHSSSKNKDSKSENESINSDSNINASENRSSSSKRRHSSNNHHHHSSSSSKHKSSHHKHSSSSNRKHSSSNKEHKNKDKEKSENTQNSNDKQSKISSIECDDKTNSKTSDSTDIINVPASSDNSLLLNLSPPNSILFDSSDEDDVMAQCKMIFEEFNANNQSKTKKEDLNSKKQVKVEEEEKEEDKYDDFSKKKRVAHENAMNIGKPISQGVVKRANHVKNAIHSIYQRQEIIRKKQAEEAAAEAAEAQAKVKEAEEKLREAEEALKRTTEKQSQLTPLVPRSYLQPGKPTKSITPVSNILALEKAKKKIEELKAQKNSINNASTSSSSKLTIAQTVTKGSGRIAHKSSTNTDTAIAPPVLEANSTKISYNIRMQYYNMMVKQCLIIYPNCEDAWDRAQVEELAVFKKCSTPIIYKNSALLTVNKLRKEAADGGNKVDSKKTESHDVILAGKLAQSSSWSIKNRSSTATSSNPFDKLTAEKAYTLVHELVLTEKQLIDNGFPRPGKRPGHAIIKEVYSKPKASHEDERYCCRCSKLFNLSMYDEVAVDECNYHPKGTGFKRGFPDNSHLCCQQPAGSPGCTYANYHVTDYVDYDNLKGFVTTMDRSDDYKPTKKDIYALDCEMCYTTHGVELTRVTVVDINSRIVYDSLVKPENKIIDYNTVYSGITEKLLENETRTIRDVQAVLLSMFHSKTILIGHSLESDLKALKLIHHNVVDTSVLFPHKQGPPKKRALKTLCIENLKRIIQENEKGHDSAEDAEVCIELVKFYLRNKINI